MKRIYIRDAEQISLQQPLSEEWMSAPVYCREPYARVVDPDFRLWLSPAESRRLGRILKRALVIGRVIADKTGIGTPDAILVGTGLGCMENTERILEPLCRDGEQMLSPTHFMQSTHNTIAALLAIHSGAHGYNITYSHKDLSFDLALQDACMQFRAGALRTALVGGFDELTPSYYTLLRRIGCLGAEGQAPGSEAAVSLLLTDDGRDALCEVAAMRIRYRPTDDDLSELLSEVLAEAGIAPEGLAGILTGADGNPANDRFYETFVSRLLPGVPALRYRHLFGTGYSASAYGVYAAAHCLGGGFIPPALRCGAAPLGDGRPQALAVLNQRGGKHYSLVILRALCGD